jgi:hypothetical protein
LVQKAGIEQGGGALAVILVSVGCAILARTPVGRGALLGFSAPGIGLSVSALLFSDGPSRIYWLAR